MDAVFSTGECADDVQSVDWSQLPKEILLQVFSCLTIEECFGFAALACSSWAKAAADPGWVVKSGHSFIHCYTCSSSTYRTRRRLTHFQPVAANAGCQEAVLDPVLRRLGRPAIPRTAGAGAQCSRKPP